MRKCKSRHCSGNVTVFNVATPTHHLNTSVPNEPPSCPQLLHGGDHADRETVRPEQLRDWLHQERRQHRLHVDGAYCRPLLSLRQQTSSLRLLHRRGLGRHLPLRGASFHLRRWEPLRGGRGDERVPRGAARGRRKVRVLWGQSGGDGGRGLSLTELP